MNYAEKWARHMSALKDFVTQNGHADVPSAYSVQTSDGIIFLGPWVSKVRGQYRRGNLLPHRAAELEQVSGWHWNQSKPGPRVDSSRDEAIKARYQAGEAARSIAKEMNITTQRVNQIVKGIKR